MAAPAPSQQPLEPGKVAALQARYPQLPQMYFDYIRSVGWGDTPSGRMLYGAPIAASEVYGEDLPLNRVILVGDDYQGFCLGFDLDASVWLEIDPRGAATAMTETAFAVFVGLPGAPAVPTYL